LRESFMYAVQAYFTTIQYLFFFRSSWKFPTDIRGQ
jgi:hypothetical protein